MQGQRISRMTCVHLWGIFSRILERRRKTTQNEWKCFDTNWISVWDWEVHFSLFVSQFLWGNWHNRRLLKAPETFLRPWANKTPLLFLNHNSDDWTIRPWTKLKSKGKILHSSGPKQRLGDIFHHSLKTCIWLMSSSVCLGQNALIDIWIYALGAAQRLPTAPQLRYRVYLHHVHVTNRMYCLSLISIIWQTIYLIPGQL